MSLKLLLTVFSIIITLINQISSVDINDLPFQMDPGNWIINAIVTDQYYDKQFKIKEYISSGKITRGKIESESKGLEITIYYSTKSPNYRNLIVKDENTCECWGMIHNRERWNYLISDANSQFINSLLMAGPSLIFRLKGQSIVWEKSSDVEVRGFNHHVYSGFLSPELKITYFVKANKGDDISLATRIIFNGRDNENVRMDIYSVERTNQELDSLITLRPGTICGNYLTEGLTYHRSSVPMVKSQRLHYILLETISSDINTITQKEVFADEKFQLFNMKTTVKKPNQVEEKSETIYDYTLGVVYELKHDDKPGRCKMLPMNLSAPGLTVNNQVNWKFSINRLLKLDIKYSYLGPVNYNNQFNSKVKVEAWQVNLLGKINNVNYDLISATQYFLPVVNANNDTVFVLKGTTFSGFNKKTQNSYTNRLSYKKMDYQVLSSNVNFSQNVEKFRISDCYPDQQSRKTLELFFSCKGVNCNHFTRNYHQQFTVKLKEAILSLDIVSISRILDIELIFESDETIAQVTFLESPDIIDSFEKKNIRISKDTMPTTTSDNINNYRDCLISNANIAEPFEAIAYCEREEKVCARFKKASDIIEDTKSGTLCEVAMIPLRNIYRYSREIPLDNMQDKLFKTGIVFELSDGSIISEYKLYMVNDISVKETESKPFFQKTLSSSKLTYGSESIIRVESVSDLSSCYQSCAHSDIIDCRSFSYCQYLDKDECLISSLSISKENITNDTYCSTNELNLLNRFDKIDSRKFIKSSSIPIGDKLENCVQLCSDSEQCKSFQYCSDAGSCTLEGHYTDSSTDSSSNCDIYIPKVIDKFKLTGNQIISDTFHTELGVNVAQCAALCYDWSDDDGSKSCSSFNFCSRQGKTSSICLLSRYSFEDVTSAKDKVKLIHEDNCHNYNRINKKNTITVTVLQRNAHFSGTLFIVFLFVIAGLLTGFIVNIVHTQVKLRKSTKSTFDRHTFSWTKQLTDNDRQSAMTQIIDINPEYEPTADKVNS